MEGILKKTATEGRNSNFSTTLSSASDVHVDISDVELQKMEEAEPSSNEKVSIEVTVVRGEASNAGNIFIERHYPELDIPGVGCLEDVEVSGPGQKVGSLYSAKPGDKLRIEGLKTGY